MSQEKAPGIVFTRVPTKTARFVNFKAEREEWNLYKIEDGTLLRARFILSGVWLDTKLEELIEQLEQGQKRKLGLGFRSQNLFTVEPRPEFRGEPDSRNYTPAELQSSIEKEDMDFETIKATWSIYELENKITMKVRLSPVSISRTTKFDNAGLRLYTVSANVDLKIELPDHLKKLFQKSKEGGVD